MIRELLSTTIEGALVEIEQADAFIVFVGLGFDNIVNACLLAARKNAHVWSITCAPQFVDHLFDLSAKSCVIMSYQSIRGSLE